MSKTSKKIKVLQVVDGYRMGGAENKLLELIQKLNHNKYEILLANVGPKGPLQPQFEALGIEIINCPRKFAFDPIPCFRLYRLILQKQIDVVQTTLFWADFIGTIAAKLAGAALILSWETVSHEGDPYHNNFQRRNGYKFMAKFNNLIVAVSNEVKTSLIQRRNISADKIQVIHYGVDLGKFHPKGKDIAVSLRRSMGFKTKDFLIGIVARLEPWKGHSIFIQAFAKIAERYPEVRVVFVGDGSLRSSLQKQVGAVGLDERIKFLGVRKDVADILNTIDLFVLPSRPGEGLPNVLLEAMACQKPVIATNVGGVPELVKNGENGYVVESGNADALATALEKVISDEAHLKKMSENALKTVTSEFSLEKELTAFEKIYDSVKFN